MLDPFPQNSGFSSKGKRAPQVLFEGYGDLAIYPTDCVCSAACFVHRKYSIGARFCRIEKGNTGLTLPCSGEFLGRSYDDHAKVSLTVTPHEVYVPPEGKVIRLLPNPAL